MFLRQSKDEILSQEDLTLYYYICVYVTLFHRLSRSRLEDRDKKYRLTIYS